MKTIIQLPGQTKLDIVQTSIHVSSTNQTDPGVQTLQWTMVNSHLCRFLLFCNRSWLQPRRVHTSRAMQERTEHCSSKPWGIGRIILASSLLKELQNTPITSSSRSVPAGSFYLLLPIFALVWLPVDTLVSADCPWEQTHLCPIIMW